MQYCDNDKWIYLSDTKFLISRFNLWKQLYLEVLDCKAKFLNNSESEFYSTFITEAQEFSRELFLDPSQCENSCYVLPPLSRETFSKKGLFWRVEKILLENYHNLF